MTDINELLNTMQERADKATPGPWDIDMDESGHDPAALFSPADDDGPLGGGGIERISELTERDAIFIAAARTDIPALINAVRASREHRLIVKKAGGIDRCDYRCACGTWFGDGWGPYRFIAAFEAHRDAKIAEAIGGRAVMGWEVPDRKEPVHPKHGAFHTATIAHLYSPIVRTGRKVGQPARNALCDISAWQTSRTVQIWHDAPDIPLDHPDCDQHHHVRYCPKCLGVAAVVTGTFDQVLAIVIPAFNDLEVTWGDLND